MEKLFFSDLCVGTRKPNLNMIYIPIDLQINTLLRLPVKSLLRFRCVSKLWSSIITSQDFKTKHTTIITASSAPPSLLISLHTIHENQLMLVSSPNPKSSFYSSSSCRVSYKDIDLKLLNRYNAVRGLICIGDRSGVEIVNPSTRQQYIFPVEGLFPSYIYNDYFFGYDPVEDQYKVLAVDIVCLAFNHSVLVLGGDGVWREVPWFGYLHCARTLGLCINGILYYGAHRMDNDSAILVSFDVRFETFKIIKAPVFNPYWLPNNYKRNFTDKTLINFSGKIAVVEKPTSNGFFTMWVLKDAEKEDWLMKSYCLPESVARLNLDVMNYFYAGEICLVLKKLSHDPFCLFFYNLEMKSIRSVTIEGLTISELKGANNGLSVTVSEHCGSFMFLKPAC